MREPLPLDPDLPLVNGRLTRARRIDRQEMRPEDPPTEPASSEDFPELPRPRRTDR